MEYGNKYPRFLEQVFTNHAIRLNNEPSKLGPRPNDWVKTSFMYDEGGFGYVMVNLDPSTNVRASVVIDRQYFIVDIGKYVRTGSTSWATSSRRRWLRRAGTVFLFSVVSSTAQRTKT